VECEHQILAQLAKQPLSFQVPQTLPSLDGKPYVVLSSGAAACIFDLIPGTLAKTTSPEEVGRATGELCSAMGRIAIDMEPPIPPYFDVFRVHHAINRELFFQQVEANPEFNVCREAIDYLAGEIRAIEHKLEAYQKLGLPMQLIHGDLHYDNVMVLGDTVSGLLDFEFWWVQHDLTILLIILTVVHVGDPVQS
jgi:homoserine kinase type II